MLIPYESLLQLPKETLDNLIKEYLLSQVEDGSFDALGDKRWSRPSASAA